jgi:hypothetical protein
LLATYQRLREEGFDQSEALSLTVGRFINSEHRDDLNEKNEILTRFAERLRKTQENVP